MPASSSYLKSSQSSSALLSWPATQAETTGTRARSSSPLLPGASLPLTKANLRLFTRGACAKDRTGTGRKSKDQLWELVKAVVVPITIPCREIAGLQRRWEDFWTALDAKKRSRSAHIDPAHPVQGELLLESSAQRAHLNVRRAAFLRGQLAKSSTNIALHSLSDVQHDGGGPQMPAPGQARFRAGGP